MFVSDMKLPGMLYGKVLRQPSYGAKLINADISKAKNIPGVIVVKDGEFIGVAARDMKTASSALLAINAKWEEKKAFFVKEDNKWEISYMEGFDYKESIKRS